MFRMVHKAAFAAAVALPFGLLALPGPVVAAVHTEGDYNTQYYIPLEKTSNAAAPVRRAAMSCTEARRMIRADGYHDVVVRDCRTPTYRFNAMRHGRPVVLWFDSRTGHLRRT